MDFKRFTAEKTGELRKFQNRSIDRDDWLFIPAEFPPAWEFPAELWPLLAEAKEALGTLNGIGQTLPNPALLLNPLQNREAITSSRIEGTFVTPRQLLLYELDPQEPESAEGELADWYEVLNYRTALTQCCELLSDAPITNRILRTMHKTLMSGVRGHEKSPGQFRRVQVQVGATGRYIPPPATELPRLMANLERYVNEADDRFDPLVICYLVHYQLEAIHPFSDGNGRIGRLLLALMIHKLMRHDWPWLYMSAFFERNKEEYIDRMFQVSARGEWQTWIEFCLYGTIVQARDSIRRCGSIAALRDDYHQRIERRATSRSHAIINQLFQSPFLTITSVQNQFDVSYATARNDVARLVEVGILQELEGRHPRSFCARELFDIAYGDRDEEPSADLPS